MENDKKHMRFLAACFAICGGATVEKAVLIADTLLERLENEEAHNGGIVDIVPKRPRKRSNS